MAGFEKLELLVILEYSPNGVFEKLRFRRPHYNMKTEFSKISTLESVFENIRFRSPKTRFSVDGRPKRINKYPFSNENGLVWTGPQGNLASSISLQLKL